MHRPISRLVLVVTLTLPLSSLVGCDGDSSSPTSPRPGRFEMTSAQVLADGQVVNGATMPFGHASGPTRFEARLEFDGRPATGGVVYCEYDRPGAMGMHRQGRFTMYDDGTHGDHVAGDGLYCLQDDEARYGCHGNGAGPGEYRYELWGEHPAHGETGRHPVTVTVR